MTKSKAWSESRMTTANVHVVKVPYRVPLMTIAARPLCGQSMFPSQTFYKSLRAHQTSPSNVSFIRNPPQPGSQGVEERDDVPPRSTAFSPLAVHSLAHARKPLPLARTILSKRPLQHVAHLHFDRVDGAH